MPEALKDIAFTLMGWLLTPLGLGLCWATTRLWRRATGGSRGWARTLGRALAVVLVPLAALSLCLGGYGLWVRYRPHPSAIERTLFPGIHYRRFARTEPRPVVVHAATIDLDTPGLAVVPTPAGTGECLPARTTSGFLADQRVQLAVNAQFFYACTHPEGDVLEDLEEGRLLHPVGVYAVDGNVVVAQRWNGNTVYFAEDGTVSLYQPPPRAHHAISGRHRLVQDGRALPVDDGLLAPRVALGFDAARRRMTVVVVDGRQRGYSEGLSLSELAALLVELGIHDAIELDGGGSAVLVAEGDDGQPTVLNSPIHERIPGRERPVANHLGIRAPR